MCEVDDIVNGSCDNGNKNISDRSSCCYAAALWPPPPPIKIFNSSVHDDQIESESSQN